MSPTWDEGMATGVTEIDEDHRKIAAAFDETLQSIAEGRGHEILVAVLSRLVDVMCEHIELESELMRLAHDPNEVLHRIEHDEYFGRLSQLVVDCEKHRRCIADKVDELARLWKFQHQERFDRPLAHAVLARREPLQTMRSGCAHPSTYR